MSLFNREVLKINDSLFIVKRIVKAEYCKDIDLLKTWANADIAFRKEDLMYLCESITDLEPETI
jgi:hypothetical protein